VSVFRLGLIEVADDLASSPLCRRIRQLFAMMDSPHVNEGANARDKLKTCPAENGLSWNELPAIFELNDSKPALRDPLKPQGWHRTSPRQ